MQTIRLDITPQTHVRATQGDRIFFRIPREDLYAASLNRLKRLERYNKYKKDLMELAAETGFTIPVQGASIKFYIPVPKSWRKWQKKMMDGKLHQSKPDLSNLLKAIEDALIPEDKIIAHYGELAKFWVNGDRGWIDIVVSDSNLEMADVKVRKKAISGVI